MSSPEQSSREDSEVEVSDQEGSPDHQSESELPSKIKEEQPSESDVQNQGASSPGPEQRNQSDEEVERESVDGDASSPQGSPQKSGDEEEEVQASTKDIFGSDSDEDEQDDRRRSRSPENRDIEREGSSSPQERQAPDDGEEDGVERYENQEDEEQPQPEIRIDAEIPRMTADLGEELFFVKFPNFLSVDTHPYDPSWYEDEIDEDEHKDQEGQKRLKLKVENTIRWKSVPDDEGQVTRESNARIVKWSDGSYTLHLGAEIFDVHKQDLVQGENSHLYVRQGVGLQGQAVFKKKLTFRPHSTESATHRKMNFIISDKHSKTSHIRMLNQVGDDPEARRSELVKREEDKLKASIRRENKQRRMRERTSTRPSAAYLEPDDEEDEDGGISLSAIKSNYKNQVRDSSYGRAADVYSDDSGDDSDFDLGRKSSEKKKARIVDSDDDD